MPPVLGLLVVRRPHHDVRCPRSDLLVAARAAVVTRGRGAGHRPHHELTMIMSARSGVFPDPRLTIMDATPWTHLFMVVTVRLTFRPPERRAAR